MSYSPLFVFCFVPSLEKRHVSPVPSRGPLVPMKPKAPAAVAPGPGDTLAFRVPRNFPHSRFSKAPLAVYPPKGARNKTWWVKECLLFFFCFFRWWSWSSDNWTVGGLNPTPSSSVVVFLSKTISPCCLVGMSVNVRSESYVNDINSLT